MVTIDDIVKMNIKNLTPIEIGKPSRRWGEKERTITFLGYFAGLAKDKKGDVLKYYEYLDAPDEVRKIIENKTKTVSYIPDNSIHIRRGIYIQDIKKITVLRRNEE